jgi:hypothetical protein
MSARGIFRDGWATASATTGGAGKGWLDTFACHCTGPKNGEPRCPCAMRNVIERDGRWIVPEQDLGPVPATKRLLGTEPRRCWSLYEIEVLSHHHVSPAPFPRASAPGYPVVIEKLRELGLMEGETHALTLLGRALIEAICSTRIPTPTNPNRSEER